MILGNPQSTSMQNTACKNTYWSRYESILKIFHFAQPIALPKQASYFQLFFFPQNILKMILGNPQSSSMQKTACKNSYWSRYESILKILHFAQPIPLAKQASYFQLFFSQKHSENDFREPRELFYAKDGVQKHLLVEI